MKGWLHGGAGNDKAAVLRGQPPYRSGYHDGNDLGPWPGTGTAVEPDAGAVGSGLDNLITKRLSNLCHFFEYAGVLL